jgi:ribosomal protein S18 acetylase RimI-like enzyme
MRETPPADASIRAATPDDIPSVLGLWDRGRSVAASLPDTAESVVRLLERDGSTLLVAELRGMLVGALIAGWDGWRGSMYRLVVDAPHRRTGIASQLVVEGERRLRDRGARRISAIVSNSEESAIALWEAAGYQRDRAVERFVKNL